MKISIIIPYFGKFPSTFSLFLRSCKYNSNYNWIILTDNNSEYNYPKNVKCINVTFTELQQIFQKKFHYNLSLEAPYKLCDYKVAYGYIFSNLLKDSDWWGYSDCDLIYGNLDKLINKDVFKHYDKIFTVGHLSFFRNAPDINQCFMKPYKGINYAKHVFTNPKIFGFDEMVINDIFLENGLKVYTEDLSANISVYYYKYHLVKRNFNLRRYMTEDYTPAKYVWENGDLKRSYFSEDDGRNIVNNFLYIHFQQRAMRIYNENDSKFEFFPSYIKGVEKKVRVRKNINVKLLLHTFSNRIRYKIKRYLSFIFHGKFTRGNYL